MIELLALSSRLMPAETGLLEAPPTRKSMSWMRSGLLADLALLGPGIPTDISTGEFTGPASTISPESFTPVFGMTTRAALPSWGTSVAKPRPTTIVPGRLITMGRLRSYTPGVKITSRPTAAARLMSAAGVDGEAMKNLPMGIEVPASVPPDHDGPEELLWTAGTNML
jgi:hypothetical protein